MVASTAPATSAASRAEVAPENSSSTSFSGSRPLALAIAIHHRLVMSPTPPVITRLPLSSFTDLMPLAPIRLWVPTARLLRNTLTLAPLSMARSVSTIDELPIGAEPAATCCTERVLAPELMKSKSRPSSLK